MPVDYRALTLVACGLLLPWPGAAQEADVSRQTLETMRRHVRSLRAVERTSAGEERALKLVDTPVLRYSDPGGITTDASIWLWGDKGRPAIVAGVFFLTQEGRDPKWSCELLSLADNRVAVSSNAGWSWSPAASGLQWLPIDDPAADSTQQRLRQMKEIAAQFEITTTEVTNKTRLRLMVQPLVRYADEKAGLIDGAIFSYAAGTNPEALLVLECRTIAGASAWRAAFVRFGANACQAQKGETIVWECAAIQKWDPKEPYFSQFGPVEKVFQSLAAGNPAEGMSR